MLKNQRAGPKRNLTCFLEVERRGGGMRLKVSSAARVYEFERALKKRVPEADWDKKQQCYWVPLEAQSVVEELALEYFAAAYLFDGPRVVDLTSGARMEQLSLWEG